MDIQIGQFAFPRLVGETLTAQSARIDSVSGATYTSHGYISSCRVRSTTGPDGGRRAFYLSAAARDSAPRRRPGAARRAGDGDGGLVRRARRRRRRRVARRPRCSWLHWVDRVFSPYRPDSDVSLLADGRGDRRRLRARGGRGHRGLRVRPELSGGYFTAAPGAVRPVRLRQGLGRRARGRDPVRRRVGQPPGQRRRRRAVRGRPPASAPPTARRPAPGRRRSASDRGGWASPTRSAAAASPSSSRPADCAVATSGIAERGAHIVNPHPAARPPAWPASPWSARRLALADAYATAAFAMGPALARDWTESLDGLRGLRDHRRRRHLADLRLRRPHRRGLSSLRQPGRAGWSGRVAGPGPCSAPGRAADPAAPGTGGRGAGP